MLQSSSARCARLVWPGCPIIPSAAVALKIFTDVVLYTIANVRWADRVPIADIHPGRVEIGSGDTRAIQTGGQIGHHIWCHTALAALIAVVEAHKIWRCGSGRNSDTPVAV